MPLIKKDEQFPERPILVLLVGTPFSRKTSLAATARNPILLDADRGGDRAYGRPDTLVIKEGWSEVEQEDLNGTFSGYDTVILDTAKAMLDDFLMEFVIAKNYKLRTNKMQMYGAIGDEFKLFVNKRRSQNMDIVVIAHDKTKDDDGIAIINPDITGGSKNLILRIADQVGYVSNKRVKRGEVMVDVVTVNFTPTETTPFCKNVAGLPELELPHFSDPRWKTFMDDEIIQPTKAAISKMTDEQRAALMVIEEWHVAIDAIIPGDKDEITSKELLETLRGISEIPAKHLSKQIRAYFTNHLVTIGWKWYDGDIKAFKPLNGNGTAPAQTNTPPADQKPDAEETAPGPNNDGIESTDQSMESNPSGLTMNGGSVVNKNPNAAEAKDDLFANKEE